MYDPRNTLAQNVAAELERHFGERALSDGHSAQHPPRRSAVARHAGAGPRAEVEGRARLPGAGRRDAFAGWKHASKRSLALRRRIRPQLKIVLRRRDARSPCAGTPPFTHRGLPMIRPKGLGRGLDALLAGTDEAAPSGEQLQTISIDRLRPGKYQPRTRMDADIARRTGAIDSRAGNHAADSRASRRGRPLRDRRRRAPLARGAAGGPARDTRAREERSRSIGARAVALIENIQREDLNPLEEAQRAAAPDRRVRTDARRGGEGGRPLAQRGVEPAAPQRSWRRPCRSTCSRAHSKWDMRARCSRLPIDAAVRRRGASRRWRAVGARNRAPGPRLAESGASARRVARAKPATTPIRHASKTIWPKGSARSCTSSPAVRARDESSSATRRSISSTASSSASRGLERLRLRKRRLVSACALSSRTRSSRAASASCRRRILRTCPAPRC